VTVSTANKVNS